MQFQLLDTFYNNTLEAKAKSVWGHEHGQIFCNQGWGAAASKCPLPSIRLFNLRYLRYCTYSNTYVDLSHHENFRQACGTRINVISISGKSFAAVGPSIDLIDVVPLYPARYRHLGRLPLIYSASW